MASGSKVAIANTSTYIQGCISWDANPDSSGNIVVNVRFYMRRTNNYSGSTYSSSTTQYICISSSASSYGYSQTTAITVAGGQQNVWQGPYFSASRTFDASRGGETIYVGWKTVDNVSGGYFNGQNNVQITLPTSTTPPTGLSVTNITPGQNSFTATVSLTGWGSGSGTKYRELQVWTYNASSLVEPRRYQTATGDSLSSDITTDNSSYGELNIMPNTKYVIGGYATNGSKNTGSVRIGDAVTLPPSSSLTPAVVADTAAVFIYSIGDQGGAYPMTVKYQLDGGSTVNIETVSGSGSKAGSFAITGLQPNSTHTITAAVSTTAGEVVSNTVTFTTLAHSTVTSEEVIYGSVSNATKRITKMYGSVGGQTTMIKKMYGSVNGKTKLIFGGC